MNAKSRILLLSMAALTVLVAVVFLASLSSSKGSTSFAAGSTALASTSSRSSSDDENEETRHVFIEGITRNLDLPAPFNSLLVAITATAQLDGTGFASDREDTVPSVACSFNITSATKHGHVFTLEGRAFKAVNPANAPTTPGGTDGLGLRIVADRIEDNLAKVTVTFIRPSTRPAFFSTVREVSFEGFGELER